MPESLTHRQPGRLYRSAEYRTKGCLTSSDALRQKAPSIGIADMCSTDGTHSARALVADTANRELPILWGCRADAMSGLGLSHEPVWQMRPVLVILLLFQEFGLGE